MNPTIISALIAVGGVLITALLTFYLWWHDSERRRVNELQISAALYINPFIDACEQLQSRIYNVFKMGGLVVLKKHYEDDEYAYEMLFQLARYFGWERIVRRYASHILDQVTIDLLEDVREAFSHSSNEKWRFYREEQKTLGQFAVRRVKGAENEFEEVPFYEFASELKSGSLSKMKSAQEAIGSICDAETQAEKIDGIGRLKKAQTILVKILNRMEKAVNYSVFKGSRNTLL
jgi:hypothetical protein